MSDPLRTLLDAATPRPWRVWIHHYDDVVTAAAIVTEDTVDVLECKDAAPVLVNADAIVVLANTADDFLALYEAVDAYRKAYFDCGKVMATNAPLVSGGDGAWEAADREYREARVAMYAARDRLRPTVEGSEP